MRPDVGEPKQLDDGRVQWLVSLKGSDTELAVIAKDWAKFEHAALEEVKIWTYRHDRWMLQHGLMKFRLWTQAETCIPGHLNISVFAERK